MTTTSDKNIMLMDAFPDFQKPGFDMEAYNARFHNANYIIHAKAKQIGFKKHWGCLSVKCAFNGNEFYECNGGSYAVNESSYLILNEGTHYSSFIDSTTEVESFTLNFTPSFESDVFHTLTSDTEFLLDNVDHFNKDNKVSFTEKLYFHDQSLSPILHDIKALSENWTAHQHRILEQYTFLYECLLSKEFETRRKIERVAAAKPSTRKELFTRLNRARDYIHSNYQNDLSLAEVANVACLNQYYFLRQFKKLFNDTPHQYLQHRRMQAAAAILRNSDHQIAEVCQDVGFSDHASFSKLFRRYFGQSPVQFRGNKV